VFRYTTGFGFLPHVTHDESTDDSAMKAINARLEIFILVLNSAFVGSSTSRDADSSLKAGSPTKGKVYRRDEVY